MSEYSLGKQDLASSGPLQSSFPSKTPKHWQAPRLYEIDHRETKSGGVPPTEDGGAWSS